MHPCPKWPDTLLSHGPWVHKPSTWTFCLFSVVPCVSSSALWFLINFLHQSRWIYCINCTWPSLVLLWRAVWSVMMPPYLFLMFSVCAFSLSFSLNLAEALWILFFNCKELSSGGTDLLDWNFHWNYCSFICTCKKQYRELLRLCLRQFPSLVMFCGHSTKSQPKSWRVPNECAQVLKLRK